MNRYYQFEPEPLAGRALLEVALRSKEQQEKVAPASAPWRPQGSGGG